MLAKVERTSVKEHIAGLSRSVVTRTVVFVIFNVISITEKSSERISMCSEALWKSGI